MDQIQALKDKVEQSKADYKQALIRCLPDGNVYRVVEKYNMADTSIPWTVYQCIPMSLHVTEAGAAAAKRNQCSRASHIEAVAAESLSADELLKIQH